MDVRADHVLDERKGLTGLVRERRATDAVRQRHEARQPVGHLDARELGAAAVTHDDREAVTQVRDVRERMARVERQRRQHGPDVALEVAGKKRLRFGRVIRGLEQTDAFGLELRSKQLLPARRHVFQHLRRALANGHELLLRVQPVRRHVVHARPELLEQRRHPHHVELVQVAGGNAEELHPLEQRMCRIVSLIEHALVEREP